MGQHTSTMSRRRRRSSSNNNNQQEHPATRRQFNPISSLFRRNATDQSPSQSLQPQPALPAVPSPAPSALDPVTAASTTNLSSASENSSRSNSNSSTAEPGNHIIDQQQLDNIINGSSLNSNNQNSFQHQTTMLARLLEVAATSTVMALLGTSLANGERFDNSSSEDTTFQEFITGLRNGLLFNELSSNPTFFRAFRFDSNSNEVPVIIFGVRSMQQTESSNDINDSNENSNRNNENNELLNEDYIPTIQVDGEYDEDSDELNVISATSSLNEIHQERQQHQHSHLHSHPPSQDQSAVRSWVIFVMGNTFTQNHPILSAPSILTENPSYQDLLNLQELIGQVKPQVVTKEELDNDKDQLFQLKVTKNFNDYNSNKDYKILDLNKNKTISFERCQICLSDYQDYEIVRNLKSCNHYFHQQCIDSWLLNQKNNCPLCRSQAIATNSSSSAATSS